MPLIWFAMLALPNGPIVVQSHAGGAIACWWPLPTLRASFLLRPHGKSLSVGAVQLRFVLLLHGSFYVAKALSVVIPGTLIDLAAFEARSSRFPWWKAPWQSC